MVLARRLLNTSLHVDAVHGSVSFREEKRRGVSGNTKGTYVCSLGTLFEEAFGRCPALDRVRDPWVYVQVQALAKAVSHRSASPVQELGTGGLTEP